MELSSFLWEIFVCVVSAAGALYSWFTTRIGKIDRRVAKLENTLAVLAERMNHFPTTRDVARLTEVIEQNNAEVGKLGTQLKAIQRQINLHQEYLLKGPAP